MKHITETYLGNYTIETTECGKQYIVAQKNLKHLSATLFDSIAIAKDMIKKFINIDLNNESEILDFVNSYGIPISLQGDINAPSYLGIPIHESDAKEIYRFYGKYCIPIDLFKYFKILIQNTFYLASSLTSLTTGIPTKSNILTVFEQYTILLFQPFFLYILSDAEKKAIAKNPFNMPFTLLDMLPSFTRDFYINMHSTEFPDNHLQRSINTYIKFMYSLGIENHNTRAKLKKDSLSFVLPLQHVVNYIYENKTNDTIQSTNETIKLSNYFAFCSHQHYTKIKFLFNALKYFKLIENQHLHTFSVSFVDSFDSIDLNQRLTFAKELVNQSHLLITDIVNIFCNEVTHKLSVDNNNHYSMKLISPSLIQSLFFEMGHILEKYQFTLCKYPSCNNLVISTYSRPALCCCHTHLTSFLRLKERNSPKLIKQ